MKKLFYSLSLAALALAAPLTAQAQSVGINTVPNASAALDVSSTTQGMLVPRMNASQRALIASPATGLMVYQTDAPAGFYFYNGTAWTSLNGNTGPAGPQGVPGPAGADGTNGATGATGPAGQGVPTGGTTGQVLAKVDGTNFNTQWTTPSGGGTTLPSQTGNSGKVLTTDGTNLSFTSYYKESLTVVRTPPSNTLNYVVPAFTNGVNHQIIVITGLWSTGASTDVKLTFPEPSTVPDGTRITVKRMSLVDGNSQTSLTIPWTGWPATSGIDGRFNISGSGTFLLNDSNNFAAESSSNPPTSTGSIHRYAIEFMKITHLPMGSNSSSFSTVQSDWVPMGGWKN